MRVHALELEDQPWYPRGVRALVQDFLELANNLLPGTYDGFVSELEGALRTSGERHLLDLCSGSSGPVCRIAERLAARSLPVTATLTDLFPNIEAYERHAARTGGRIGFHPHPIDAANVPAELRGFRLLCNAFHHFAPAPARAILADAAAKQRGIAVVEMVSRHPLAVIFVFFGLLLSLVSAPFVRPFKLSRLFFTYLVPIVPITVLWDGLVSCLRVYTPAELRKMTEGLGTDRYRWKIGRLPMPGTLLELTYVIGLPASVQPNESGDPPAAGSPR